MNDGHPSGGQPTTPSSTPPINNGQQPVVLSPQQSDPAQAQGVVGSQAVQPQMIQPQVVSSDTGDIVLGGSEPKKSKKGLIVGIVFLALVLVGVGAGAMLLLGGGSVEGGSEENSFEDFVSYLMDGNDNNEIITDFNPDDFYAVDRFFYRYETEDGKEYFKRLSQHWERFAKVSKGDENQKELTAKIGDGVSVMNLYVEKGIISGEEILRKYLSGGEYEARTYFLEYFASDNAVSDMEMQYLAYQDDYLDDVLDMIRIYGENGCIIDDGVDEMCVEEKGLYNSGEYQQMIEEAQVIQDYVAEIKDRTKVACGELIKLKVVKNE